MPEGVGYGSQFTASKGLELNVIGAHCYAYQSFAASETSTVQLSFTTGNYYVVGKIRLAGMIDLATPANGRIATMTVKMNGNVMLISKTDAAEEDMPSSDVVPLLIPPFTVVEVITDSNDTSATYQGTVSLTGRIYK